MEKIIVRNKITKKAEIESNFLRMFDSTKFKTIKSFEEHYGIENIMKNVFNEEVSQKKLQDSLLYKEYLKCVEEKRENRYFKLMYKVRDNLALTIDEHIYIYHLVKKNMISDKDIIPWYYVDSKQYIADSWWENDNVIIEDFNKLSYLDFILKYKAY